MQRKILNECAEEDLRNLISDFCLQIDADEFISELTEEVSKKKIPHYYKGYSRRSDYCYDIGYQKLLPLIIEAIERYDELVA